MRTVFPAMSVEQGIEFVNKIMLDPAVKYIDFVDALTLMSHSASVSRSWWHDDDGKPEERNFGELIALIHSEVSEAMEGGRKDKMDEHCPEYLSVEIELADALLRIFDLAFAANLNLGEAFMAKWQYNLTRPDHAKAHRSGAGGKQF
jgi:NTP pyrophosphatase (non-canonical NTP hydrolase)